MEKRLQGIVDQVVQIILSYCSPERILLFGSHAKGKARSGSDLDFMVIWQTDIPRRFRGAELTGRLADFPVNVDVLFYTPEEIETGLMKKHSFVSSVMQTGVDIL